MERADCAIQKEHAINDFEKQGGLALRSKKDLHCQRWGKLPMIHRDPFDRLLIAQAKTEGCSLVSRDPEIQKYPVTLHWK